MNEEKFIALVQQYPAIFDINHYDYANKQLKENIWKDISENMGTSANKCKTKWKVLRDSFHRNINKRNSCKLGEIHRPFKYEHQMNFLLPYFRGRKFKVKSSSHESYEDSNDGSVAVFAEPSFIQYDSPIESAASPLRTDSRSTSPDNHLQRRFTQHQDSEISEVVRDYLDKREQEQDPIMTFFRAMAETVSQFPSHLQLKVKNKVYKAVSQAELEYIEAYNAANGYAENNASHTTEVNDNNGSTSSQFQPVSSSETFPQSNNVPEHCILTTKNAMGPTTSGTIEQPTESSQSCNKMVDNISQH